ncbi:DUF2062 domain-containing protein [Vitiosangium sp. GDMCC 1.1324]|uniref:DUF2062 domain-containing protein n=1 Tax=Vitiosangium sp. (strain GDMCC 1.1324) TaxID=2138576 RepID=UPI00130DEF10|nr:DUF2062 domain-containing protein [Vitiosangium sp. GDMCC 1.1324]
MNPSGPVVSPPSSASSRWRGKLLALLRPLREQIESVKREHASPRRLGVAVAVGVLVGSSPFLGFQVLMAIALATVFRLNRIAVLLGLQISMPPITPFLLFLNAQVGARLLEGRWLPLSLEAFRAVPAKQVAADLFLDLLVGGLLVGGVLAAGLGWMTAYLLQRQRTRGSLSDLFTPEQWAQLQGRLEGLPRAWRKYALWKMRLDPVYKLILPELPEDAELLDLGSGMGLLPLLLSVRSPRSSVRAVEWDERKVRMAHQLLEGLPAVRVEAGDASKCPLGTPNAVALLDVLHYSPIAQQQEWLLRCAEALRPGGLLLVRELEPKQSRWPLAPVLERLAVRLGWNRGASVHAWSPSEMARMLTPLGFTAELRPAGSGVFSANTLLIARKASQTQHGH